MDTFIYQNMLTCIGNKRKLIPKIFEIVSDVKDNILEKDKIVFCDGFAGSSVVSRGLSSICNKIYLNDMEYYAYLMAKCFMSKPNDIQLEKIKLHIHNMNEIAENGPYIEGIICENYAPKNTTDIKSNERCFYTRENALIIDTLRQYIEENAIDFAVASCSSTEIDEINILKASHLAMHRCIDKLNIEPELLLVDGNLFTRYLKKNGDIIEHICIIKGDGKFSSISAASILAKTYHDDFIENLLDKEPELEKYGWRTNMSYGTQKHMDAIKKYGLTKYHRKSFNI